MVGTGRRVQGCSSDVATWVTRPDFNFGEDPEAAHVVITEIPHRMTLICSEACRYIAIDWVWFEGMLNTDNAMTKFLREMLAMSIQRSHAKHPDRHTYYSCDLFTMAIALDESIITAAEHVRCSVNTTGVGKAKGMLIVKDSGAKTRLVVNVDKERLKATLSHMFFAAGGKNWAESANSDSSNPNSVEKTTSKEQTDQPGNSLKRVKSKSLRSDRSDSSRSGSSRSRRTSGKGCLCGLTKSKGSKDALGSSDTRLIQLEEKSTDSASTNGAPKQKKTILTRLEGRNGAGSIESDAPKRKSSLKGALQKSILELRRQSTTGKH